MKIKNTLLTAALLTASSVAVNAATQTFNDSTAFTFTTTLSGVNQLTLSQFDTSLGTLTGVAITIQYTVAEQTLELDNDATGVATGNYGFGEFGNDGFSASASTLLDGSVADLSFDQVTVGDFDYTVQTTAYNLTADTGTEGLNTFDTQPGDGDYLSFVTTETTLGVVDRLIDSAAWGQYEGAGSISYDLAKSYSTNYGLFIAFTQ